MEPWRCFRRLYLDADTLTLGSVEGLVNAPLKDNTVGAVADKRIARAGYFNSGVMLVDNDAWGSGSISGAAIDRAAELGSTAFPEQDALNEVLADVWMPLPGDWNWEVPPATAYRRLWRCWARSIGAR